MARSARVQKFLEEAADLTPAEREELAEELTKASVVTTEDMERQRRAVLDYLAVPTFKSGSSVVSSDKYAALKAHRDVEG